MESCASFCSMTGYGEAYREECNYSVYVVIRTLNSKYLDLHLSLPNHWIKEELNIRKKLGERFHRGKVLFNVVCAAPIDKQMNSQYELLKGYSASLKKLSRDVELSFAELAPVFPLPQSMLEATLIRPGQNSEKEKACLFKTIDCAIEQCLESRKKEGLLLTAKIIEYWKSLQKKMSLIDDYMPLRRKRIKKKIEKKIEARENTIDLKPWQQEIFAFIEKIDIEEERVRLHSHLYYFGKVINQNNGIVGKKLAFLAQEINREINTLAAKAQDTHLQHWVVEMKEALEQIKEQLQNVI